MDILVLGAIVGDSNFAISYSLNAELAQDAEHGERRYVRITHPGPSRGFYLLCTLPFLLSIGAGKD